MAELGLQKYDAMCHAIAECFSVDEAKELRDKARALEVYAAQAMNTEAERKAAEIRIRAEPSQYEALDAAQAEVISPLVGDTQVGQGRFISSAATSRWAIFRSRPLPGFLQTPGGGGSKYLQTHPRRARGGRTREAANIRGGGQKHPA
jgi:hypothetical protein